MQPGWPQFHKGTGCLALAEFLLPFATITPDGGYQLTRQGIDHGRTDSMQSTRMNVVVSFAEFGA